jgi:UDP-GlcNAc3NAcA epimerase
MKILSIVGARPQFIKAAAVSRALRARHTEVLVHTGQHYDDAMSEVFFRELGIPSPDFNLGIGSGSHAEQIAQMLVPLERLILAERPDSVLVYGDTNTTLAGGLAAAKGNVPLTHVEAGLRSFERSMPEEVNRVVVDHLSALLLCPTRAAVENLQREGITAGVELVGDVMLDTARRFAETWPAGPVLEGFAVEPGRYYLATVHRAANADSPERLAAIVEAFESLPKPVIWPVHPRTAKELEAHGLSGAVAANGNIRAIAPLSYRQTSALLRSASALLTDSGGMQKEAYFFRIPCVTLREESEWVETVESGWNVLAGTDKDAIVTAATSFETPLAHPDFYGDGHAAERVVAALERHAGC